MSIARLLGTALLAVLLSACSRDISVSVTFEGAGPLKTGAPVYFNDVQIGEVADSTITGDLMKADLSLDPELAAGLKSGSAALLGARDGQPVVTLYNYRPGREPLQSGGELIGLNDPLELAAWRTGEALDTGSQSMEEVTRSMTEYFESEEWQQRKEEMNRRMEALQSELGRTYEETNRAYNEFLEDLESQSEAARERAQESYSRLTERLRQDIARLKEQGNEELVEPLMRLLEDLSRAMEKKPEQEST